MNSKLIILSGFLILSFAFSKAQVVINKAAWLDGLCQKYDQYSKVMDETPGYRLQIMYSNDKAQVNTVKSQFYRSFPSVRAYVNYEQPYYKLRVGDFRSRLDAARGLDMVSALYPGAFLVKDRVKIR